ncbi:Cysteine proteinases superfamily protein [Abeliophyllum distichum]|uniref:ubiquitinyl hydrolase 1 n=1 Tax=Abeliophyllum distichum TaxID=126358 RepID=A0ABD1ULE7_9LAMI
MYELDPDVVRWGLHLIDVCSLTNCGSPVTVTCYDKDSSQIESVKEGYLDTTHSILENDEVIARALQEELSRLTDLEASGSEYAGEQHQQESILAQYWLDPSKRNLDSEYQSNQEAYERGTVLCNLGELSIECEDQTVLPEIEDESALDGEMGRRLNQMVPVSHVPKINGEIPCVDEVTSDHQRLLDRLQLYDLVELKISGDGNCQFRSLSDQIYRTPEHHKFVREQVVNQLKSHPELYENYVPMAYASYVQKMKKTGEWGDHVTLQAAADSYGIKISVITSFKDTCYIEILPHTQKSNRIIFLSFWAEVHYNSIYPLGELPEVEVKKKKRWWLP